MDVEGEPMTVFQELVVEMLRTYLRNPPEVATILGEQIAAIDAFRIEVNGYGAYCHISIRPGVRGLPPALCGRYLPGPETLVKMNGQPLGLQFVVTADDNGYIDLVEIFPTDGVGWDGVVQPYEIVDLEDWSPPVD